MHTLNADLHCHSVVSDGTLTPEALACRAHANGVQVWSLTDHDEVGGQERAKKAAEELGMQYISGVEISVTWSSQTVHIVGLGIDYTNAALIEGLYQTRNGRSNRAKAISAQLDQIGIKNAYEGALQFVGNPELISRTHFARFLVDSGVCKDTNEVFANYLIEGKPGYVGHELMVPEQGSYRTLSAENEGRLLVRNQQGIELLSNVCRHRQALMLNGSGQIDNIVCPLHRWTYDLEGQLLGAPHFGDKPCLNLGK